VRCGTGGHTGAADRACEEGVVRRATVAVDSLVALTYLIAANPALTGLAVHEWAGMGALVVFAAHCALHYDWVVATVRRHTDRVSVTNLVLDAATLVAFITCTVSGLMVSRHILPLLGFVAPGYFLWNPVHSLSAKALLALLVVHVVLHWKWIAGALRKPGRSRDDESEH
jgi:hypothetical protein